MKSSNHDFFKGPATQAKHCLQNQTTVATVHDMMHAVFRE